MRTMNVQFTDDTDAALERLAALLGTSKAGVLRFGISLVALAQREEREGNALGVVRGERVVKEVATPWLTRA